MKKNRELIRIYIGYCSKKSVYFGTLYLLYIDSGAVCYTDFWEAYSETLPCKRHRPVGKESGKASHIERLNNTLRQQISQIELTRIKLKPLYTSILS